MNCNEFQDQLPELLDREQPSLNAARAAHLAECPACREAWEEMLELGKAIHVWRQSIPVPSAEFKSRVVAAWRNGETVSQPILSEKSVSSRTAPRRRQTIAAVMATAALLLVSGLVLRMGQPNSTRVENPTPPTVSSNITPSKTSELKSPAMKAVADRTVVTTDAGALLRETTTALRGAADALLPVNTAFAGVPSKSTVSPSSASPKRDGTSSLSLAQELSETLDDLWLASDSSDSQT